MKAAPNPVPAMSFLIIDLHEDALHAISWDSLNRSQLGDLYQVGRVAMLAFWNFISIVSAISDVITFREV